MDILFGLALSYHVEFEGTYNNVHPHIRLQQEHFIAGMYYNSESNVSTYTGLKYNLNDFFIEGGAVTGYSEGDVIPFARAGYELGDFSLFVAPAIETIDGVSQVKAVIGFEIMKKVF
jgi:hypothetical protein